MIANQEVYNRSGSLPIQQQVLFGLVNTLRVIELYKLFDQDVEESNLEPLNNSTDNYSTLREILDFAFLHSNVEEKDFPATKMSNDKELCLKVAPGDEDYGGIETTLAQNVATLLATALDFMLTKKINYLNECSDYLINIVDAIKGDEYFSKKITQLSLDEFSEKAILAEVVIQLELINKLPGSSLQELYQFADNNKIEFNQ